MIEVKPTKQGMAALEVVLTVADAIQELGSIPNSHLYARLMAHMELRTYQTIIEILVRNNLITNRSNLLVWIGPKKEGK